LSAIAYRIGTHSAFLETMKARLSNWALSQPAADRHSEVRSTFPLLGLRTRNAEDPSIALLDAWAVIADVLTFYQERIANEGYLRTATERRSIVELARLIGFRPRPGVAASVYLAYTMEKGHTVEVPAGSRVQSTAGPGELPQSFETSALLKASDTWNNLVPRMTRPHKLQLGDEILYFKGTATNLKPNDRLLLVVKDSKVPRRILTVEPDNYANRTKVTLEAFSPPAIGGVSDAAAAVKPSDKATLEKPSDGVAVKAVPVPNLSQAMEALIETLSSASGNNAASSQQPGSAFASTSDLVPRLAGLLRPEIADQLYTALENAVVSQPDAAEVHAFRARASAFGHNAPKKSDFDDHNRILDPIEWPLTRPVPRPLRSDESGLVKKEKETEPTEMVDRLSLDNVYDKVVPGGWMLLESKKFKESIVTQVKTSVELSRADYGISGKVTEVKLGADWLAKEDKSLSAIRGVAIFTQSEKLELAEDPILVPVDGNRIELDRIYRGLEAGRWLIISGERADIGGTSKVLGAELVRLASSDISDVPDNNYHTWLTLADAGLAASYKRDTVTIYGNVAHATHGETRSEVLGSGDATRPLQTFELKQFPLTHVSAATPSGIEDTLKVFINGIRWREGPGLSSLTGNSRSYVTSTRDDSKTSVVFGNGVRGARVPSGIENIKAVYRIGIGKAGNVAAGQIKMLATKPLGLKDVINPIRASGGADRDSRDDARRNAPLAVMSLDRLVSVQDYADFARTFGGVGKAMATEVVLNHASCVHVTVAGVGGSPIDDTSDLFRNLRAAFGEFGDPQQHVELADRELMLIVIHASIAIMPDYQFEAVASKVRFKLLNAFSFDNRDLGQQVHQGQVIAIVQNTEGVQFVQLETFASIRTHDTRPGALPGLPTGNGRGNQCIPVKPGRFEGKTFLPAQLAFLTPGIPETLILTELPHA
jgi:predicted phage baseplate assembly protein